MRLANLYTRRTYGRDDAPVLATVTLPDSVEERSSFYAGPDAVSWQGRLFLREELPYYGEAPTPRYYEIKPVLVENAPAPATSS